MNYGPLSPEIEQIHCKRHAHIGIYEFNVKKAFQRSVNRTEVDTYETAQ